MGSLGEPVGLIECDEGWQLVFGPLLLGTIAHGGDRLRKPKRQAGGLVENPDRFPTSPPAQQQQQQG